MAESLNDREIMNILGSVIVNGDPKSVRPNSYVLRLGSNGEFLTTGKEFSLGDSPGSKKGIKVAPGQSVALTALETIDFRRDTVEAHFPDCDLHAVVSPTTDLQREGVVAPTTQVDAGYQGTLNWTLANSSSEERRFVFKERLFRLAILKLAKGERPEALYEGAYQGREGYIRSERSGAPTGMRAADWEDSATAEGPDALLERVIKSGFPWNALGTRLKAIDDQFKTVTHEYADIRDAIERLERDVEKTVRAQDGLTDRIRRVVREELPAMQDRWLVIAGGALMVLLGLLVSIWTSEDARNLLLEYGSLIGPGTLLLGAGAVFWQLRRKRTDDDSQ